MTSAALAYHAKIGQPASGVIAAALLALTSTIVAIVSADGAGTPARRTLRPLTVKAVKSE
jgi:hypothetical protein